MEFLKKHGKGILLCLAIAVPSWFLGKAFPIIGGAVIAILAGMVVTLLLRDKSGVEPGIRFVSKKVLQWAVILLGFGMDLNVVVQTGRQSLPIIVCTISVSLLVAFFLRRWMQIPGKVATLVGVGSSICGGSAIAATAPVIDADEEEVAQAISVIFFFNVLAALLFPALGQAIGFDTTSGEAFGIFAGTAVNDTSSVTATAATWDSMWNLGSATLDKAVTVKLTRTLAIIPITLVLAFLRTRREKQDGGNRVDFKKIFPFFILFFIAASIVTTVAVHFGVSASVFDPVKELSKFLIVLAMAAIGLNTNIVKLVRSGGKPIALGGCCWVSITAVSLLMQHLLGLM
ncbi:YeiH family protein [uncultured Oscillibacter sp.]|uniref:YeiH family protein n=1 Tax=uncultured Oscillibacter sp. TaxID=876091 RepID=UPI00280C0A88|nr:YeiH family protein [uncultured Oscillibacter sp.]